MSIELILIACISTAIAGPAQVEPAMTTGAPQREGTKSQSEGFVENLGQWSTDARYLAQLPGALVHVERAGFGVQIESGLGRGVFVRQLFEGADASVEIVGDEQVAGLRHYFIGNDSSKWVRNARAFRRVVWRELYPGIDVVLRFDDGPLEYDLLLRPGADPDCVSVRCDGVESMEVDAERGVVLHTAVGTIEHRLGHCWQVDPKGGLHPLEVRYRQLGQHVFGFAVSGRDPALAAVIDPELLWATYFGGVGLGGQADRGISVAFDQLGDVYAVGEAALPGLVTTPGTYQHPDGGPGDRDMFVAKFRGSTGALVFSSQIGSANSADLPHNLALDASGRSVVVGRTGGMSFPTTPGAFDPVMNQSFGDSGYALRLSASGDNLEFSTFLEGSTGNSFPFGVAVASTGAVVVVGMAGAPDFPATPGAFDSSFDPNNADGFVLRLDPTGSALEWSTFLGGTGTDDVYAVVLDAQDRPTVAGRTRSPNFPKTTGAFSTTWPGAPWGNFDQGFVTRLTANGSALVWSSYLGGSMGHDFVSAIAVAPNGDAIAGGGTQASNFPTTPGAFQPIFVPGGSGNYSGFVSRLKSDGTALVASTILGLTGNEYVTALRSDASGVVTAGGEASAGDFPTTPGAFQTQYTTNGSMFVTRLDPALSRLLYSTYLGGPNEETARGVASSSTGRVSVIGDSRGGFPTTPNAFSPNFIGGGRDAVVATFDPLLDGVEITTPSVPSCLGLLQLHADPMPVAGEPCFKLSCSQAPPNAVGWLAVRMHPTFGPNNSVEPVVFPWRIGAHSDANGWAETTFPLTDFAPGTLFEFRYVSRNTAACGGVGSLSVSNGLLVTVQ